MSRWQVLIQSFSADSLKTVHTLDARLPLIFLGNPTVASIPSYADYAVGLGPSFGASINAAWVNTAHANCLDVHPYTINTAANMNAALAAGVDGMFTNFSDVLIGILGPRKATGLQGALDAKNAHDACLARTPEGGVGGAVPATLALTLGGPASFGAFTPGVAKDYTASTTANVVSTAGDAALTTERSGPPDERDVRAARTGRRRAQQVGVDRAGVQRSGHGHVQAAHRRRRRAAHGRLCEDAHADAVHHDTLKRFRARLPFRAIGLR